MVSTLLTEARELAAQAGLNLFGTVSAARFDECQPCDRRVRGLRADCGTVVVLGTGGRQFWQAYAAHGGRTDLPAQAAAAAADRFARLQAKELLLWLQQRDVRGAVVEPGAAGGVRFACLGEAAGLGTVSPVTGQLLHPEFGPWLALRALLLLDGEPFGPVPNASIAHRFQPCCGCSRPCVSACAPQACDGEGQKDLERCAPHRDAGNCETGCNTRLACPLGANHRDADGEYAHRHEQTLAVLRRLAGLGLWRLVPRSWRL